MLHGDTQSEGFLSEIINAVPWPNQRHWNMESIYEYGEAVFGEFSIIYRIRYSRYCIWNATALARSPEQVYAMQSANWEIASHGYKWIEHKDLSQHEEEEQIKKQLTHTAVTGNPSKGWYTEERPNSVDLVCKQGILDYVSDSMQMTYHIGIFIVTSPINHTLYFGRKRHAICQCTRI